MEVGKGLDTSSLDKTETDKRNFRQANLGRAVRKSEKAGPALRNVQDMLAFESGCLTVGP